MSITAATSSPVRTFELGLPDLGPWRHGNTGTEGVWRFASSRPGPRVAVTALVHGNELCGAWAAVGLLQWLQAGVQLQCGELTVALCNLAAFDRFDAAQPDASRFVEEDMNRQWDAQRLATGSTLERRRAAELLPWVCDADYLLDLHSMHEPGPPLLLTGMLPRNVEFVRRLGLGGCVVMDAGHSDGLRLRDQGRFGDPNSSACSLLIECGWHGDPTSRRVAEDATGRLMLLTGLLNSDTLPRGFLLDQAPATWAAQVTDAVVARSMDFRFAHDYSSLELIAQKGTVIAYDEGQPVRTPYDDCMLVMPSLRQLRPGVTVVRLARRTALRESALPA